MVQATHEAVRREITVDAAPEKAFRVFTERFDSWWPRSHSIAEADMAEAIIEPREGGRWYERGVDGSDLRLGRGARLGPAAQADPVVAHRRRLEARPGAPARSR